MLRGTMRVDNPAGTTLASLVLPVYIPALLLATGSGAMNTFLPLYLRELGASVSLAATLVGLGTAGVLIFDLPSGMMTARFGERRVLGWSGAVMVLATLFTGLSRSLAAVTVGIFLTNAAASFWLLGRLAFMRAVLGTDRRGRGLAAVGGVMRVGLFVGPVVGGFAAEAVGYRAVFLGNSAFALASLVLFLASNDRVAVPASATAVAAELSPRSVLRILRAKRGVFLTAGLSMLVLAMVRAGRSLVFPLWGQSIGLDARAIGIVVGLSAAAETLMFLPAGLLSDRLGRKWSAVSCLMLLSAGMALVPLTRGYVPFLLAGLVVGLGNGLGSGINMTLGADFASGVEPSLFLGLWRLVTDLGVAGAPLLIGLIAGSLALGPATLAIAGLGLAGGVFHAAAVAETLERRER
jgi:MFS family permease